MGSSEEEAAAPLLLLPAAAAAAEERCPGCVQEQRKARRGGRIPYTELFFVAVTTLASCNSFLLYFYLHFLFFFSQYNHTCIIERCTSC